MGSRLGSALTRKLGPLPAWAWLAIAAGAILLYRRLSGGGGLGSLLGGHTGSGTSQSAGGNTNVGAPNLAGDAGSGLAPPPPADTLTPGGLDNGSFGNSGGPVVFDPLTGAYTGGTDTGIPIDQPTDTGIPDTIIRRRYPAVPIAGITEPKRPGSTSGNRQPRTPGTGHTVKPTVPRTRKPPASLATSRVLTTAPAAPPRVRASRSGAHAPSKRVNFQTATRPAPGFAAPPAPPTRAHQVAPKTAPSVPAAMAISRRTGVSVVKIQVTPKSTPAPAAPHPQAAPAKLVQPAPAQVAAQHREPPPPARPAPKPAGTRSRPR